ALLSLIRDQGYRNVALGGPALSRLRCDSALQDPDSLFSGFRAALVHGLDADSDGGVLTAWLTNAALQRPATLDSSITTYSFPTTAGNYCRQLTGLSFELDNHRCTAFQRSASYDGLETLMAAQGLPVFARIERAGCQLFLLASSEIVDVEDKAVPGDLRTDTYPSLIPWMVFLRAAFGDFCCHNPSPCAALIIDDPLLRPSYGFLNYEVLLREMDRHGFVASIAFIPWNYRRNASETVAIFRRRNDKLSLCAHGCDHTEREFAATNEATLKDRAATALARLCDMEQSTGLTSARVMVFPQGLFSSAAMSALKSQGFLAAINTGVFAEDWHEREIRLGDLLDVAVSYEGFPLFQRRYPKDLLSFAVDLFLGKPALIVEHHGYFRNGYRDLAEFVARVNALEPRISWGSVGRIVRTSVLERKLSNASVEVKFYSDQLALINRESQRLVYRLRRNIGDTHELQCVLCNGLPVDYRQTGNLVEFEIELEPGVAAEVELVRSRDKLISSMRKGLGYTSGVAARRYLSEFRDNVIARWPYFLRYPIRSLMSADI
ncbi:MAG: hypothetical protein ABSD31_17900, partial [Candidatus Binataceae bacterium]